jgi:hypothetical protein
MAMYEGPHVPSCPEYDPAKEPCDPRYHILACPCQLPLNGPGGTTTHIENDEKGILETNLARTISYHMEAALGSNHDAQRQGIYRTNSMGDND